MERAATRFVPPVFPSITKDVFLAILIAIPALELYRTSALLVFWVLNSFKIPVNPRVLRDFIKLLIVT